MDVSGLILLFLVDEYLLVFIGSVAELIAFGFLYFFFFFWFLIEQLLNNDF